jgi:hypothetical protein
VIVCSTVTESSCAPTFTSYSSPFCSNTRISPISTPNCIQLLKYHVICQLLYSSYMARKTLKTLTPRERSVTDRGKARGSMICNNGEKTILWKLKIIQRDRRHIISLIVRTTHYSAINAENGFEMQPRLIRLRSDIRGI